MELTCPKCQGVMRSYERNAVTVDQCSECRGIFLDRGELEKLVDAENAWHRDEPDERSGQTQPSYDSSPGRSEYGGQGDGYGRRPKKRKSFLDELFD